MRHRRAIGILLGVLWLAGCSASSAPGGAGTPPAAGGSPSRLATPPVAWASPSPPAGGGPHREGVPAEASAVVAQAVADAATRTGVSPDDVRVLRVEPRDWPDSALGCPRAGMGYAQVITPGYLILLEAGGRTLEYHADRTRAEWCAR